MKNLPILENGYVKLIPPILNPEEIKKYQGWLNEPKIIEGIGQLEKLTEKEIFELLNGWKEEPLKMHWFVSLRESGLLVGDLNLDIVPDITKEYPELSDLEYFHVQNDAEIKIMISGNYQNQGIGKLATRACINYGFNQKKLDAIYASIYENNISSKKLFEKLGFENVGSLREKRTGRDEVIVRLMKR